MKVKLTKSDASEIDHKLRILASEPDLQEDYGITKDQADALVKTIPDSGEWAIPDWAVEVVKGEMADHALVLRVCADAARKHLNEGQALTIDRQAKKFEEVFK